MNYLFDFYRTNYLYKKLKKFKKEDVAHTAQYYLEKEVCFFVKYWLLKTGHKKIALGGGLFSNVKINQKISELEELENIFIFPHMGDGGLGFGALMDFIKPVPFKLKNIYLGQSFSNKEIERILKKFKLKYYYFKNIEGEIVDLLKKGRIVARFKGRAEYGPRALGNRSILVEANKKQVNKKLNKKLNRTEFMPFAPVIADYNASKSFKNFKKADYTSKFMNISFTSTRWFEERCPAVVHIDNTSRPQILSKEDNPDYFYIIDKYYKETGLPGLVNTSFNMHEEPIVNTPEEAIKTFLKAKLDYLAIGNYLVFN